MTKKQLIKELEQFTKEEIIESIYYYVGEDFRKQHIITGCHQLKLDDENRQFEAARVAWKAASQEHIDYINKIKVQYKGVNYTDLPVEVIQKIRVLGRNEERRYKELVTLQDKIDNHYKMLKAR